MNVCLFLQKKNKKFPTTKKNKKNPHTCVRVCTMYINRKLTHMTYYMEKEANKNNRYLSSCIKVIVCASWKQNKTKICYFRRRTERTLLTVPKGDHRIRSVGTFASSTAPTWRAAETTTKQQNDFNANIKTGLDSDTAGSLSTKQWKAQWNRRHYSA